MRHVHGNHSPILFQRQNLSKIASLPVFPYSRSSRWSSGLRLRANSGGNGTPSFADANEMPRKNTDTQWRRRFIIPYCSLPKDEGLPREQRPHWPIPRLHDHAQSGCLPRNIRLRLRLKNTPRCPEFRSPFCLGPPTRQHLQPFLTHQSEKQAPQSVELTCQGRIDTPGSPNKRRPMHHFSRRQNSASRGGVNHARRVEARLIVFRLR